RIAAGLLSDEERAGDPRPTDEELLLDAFADATDVTDDMSDEKLVRELLLQARKDEDARREYPSSDGSAYLTWGPLGKIQKTLGIDELRFKILRNGLRALLAHDKTYNYDDRDGTFKEIDKAMKGDIDFLIAGHTHLARAFERAPGQYYFNSGTWIRLIRLPNE